MPLFAQFPEPYLDMLSRSMSLKSFKAREWIFCEGDTIQDDQSLYLVLQGRVEIWITTQPRHANSHTSERIMQLLYDGDFLGEYALTTGQPRNASAAAAISTYTARLPKTIYDRLCTQNPQLAMALHNVLFAGMAQRQIRSNDLTALHHLSPVRLRMIKFLIMMARPTDERATEYIIDHLNGNQIADMLCIERTTVSETLQVLEKEELIDIERRRHNYIHIPSLECLQAVFQQEQPSKRT